MQNVSLLKKYLVSLVVLGVVLVKLVFPYMSTQLPTGHDIEVHGVRLANYYLALKQGQFPPQWAPNMNHGFGYPVFIYSYQLPYLLGSFFFAITNSVELSLNSLGAFSVLLAISGTYYLSLKIQKNARLALLATLLYVLSPYYLLTLTIRGAIAELLFLSILPWSLAFVTKAKQDIFNSFLILVTTIALITSHHISLMVALPLLFSWAMYQGITTKKSKETFVYTLLPLIFAVIATSFYWVPALLETQLIEVAGSTFTQVSQHFIRATDLVWMLWDCGQYCYIWQQRPVPTFLGPAVVGLLMISLWYVHKSHKEKQTANKTSTYFWIGVSLLTTLFVLPFSFPLWQASKLIAMIEFPWLLLWVPTIGMIITLLYIDTQSLGVKKIELFFTALIIAQTVFAFLFWTTPRGHFSKPLEDWLQFGDITQNYDGLLPRGFDNHKNLRLVEPLVVRAQDQLAFETTGQSQPTQSGTASIVNWVGTEMEYTVSSSQSGFVIQKTSYFPGWHATVDGKEVEILHTDTEFPGRILIPITAGEHTIKVFYTGDTPARTGSKISSLIGLLTFSAYLCGLHYKTSKKRA